MDLAHNELVVLVTAATIEEATRIGRRMVEEKLAACANIVPGITSIFHWEGKISEEREILVLLKTRDDLFLDLTKAVKEIHSYEVPEIIALPIVDGAESYLKWIRDSTRNPLK
jgi:periplasmic divalent cation tolerance protein